jgi:integrase
MRYNIAPKKEWQPKDREARSLPMHHQLRADPLDLKAKSDSRYVFGQGYTPCPNKLLLRLKRLCRRAKVPEITVHDLRNEFASHLVMGGVGIETVSKLLGHSNIEMTWNHYVHLAPDRLKDAVEILDWGQERSS